MSVTRRGLRMPDRDYEGATVKAGILENATYPADTLTDQKTGRKYPDPRAGMAVATIAAALNYGTAKIPPRPFMEMTLAREQATWINGLTKLIAGGMSVSEALRTIGQVMKEDIRQTIVDWPADNSERWAESKGFNHGLTFTYHMLNSVESEIETPGGG